MSFPAPPTWVWGSWPRPGPWGWISCPLLPERYDLVVPETTFSDTRFQTLLAVIRSREFQAAAAALGGYDLKDCGTILWEQ